ncbi:unnamed protein product [Urochloa decumbens]|uniref:RING-type domain-containing protein n=1 Tax=Urochloa decumbens TaxID=240449 RepID=A0ABC9H751_9POAL
MGLSSGLHDVSGAAPLPLLLLASIASALASLFSALSSSPSAGANPNAARFSGLDALVALVDYLGTSRVSIADGAAAGDCAVCLSAIAEGERVRTLACRHAFHAACLDGWFDQSRLSCPLCRAGEDAVSWFTRF